MPSAFASLESRRHAQRVLREIDELLMCGTHPEEGNPRSPSATSSTGSIYPNKEMTMWRRGAAALAMHAPTRPHNHKVSILRREFARENKMPGPGAYHIQSAYRVTKPTIRAASIRAPPPIQGVKTALSSTIPDHALEISRADKWLSTYREPRGAVAYTKCTTTVAKTKEQRETLRRIAMDKSKQKRIGFYSVNHALTERRTGAVGIVPMARSASRAGCEDKRQVEARTRRKIRALDTANISIKLTDLPTKQDKHEEKAAAPSNGPTEQRLSALARLALKHKEKREQWNKKVETRFKPTAGEDDRRLPAHDMSKHQGRDTVRCRQKRLRVVTDFAALPRHRDFVQASRSSSPHSKRSPRTLVTYDKMQGRGDCVVDADGIILVGRDQELALAHRREEGATDRNDTFVRPRVPGAVIRPTATPERSVIGKRELLQLSPKFDYLRDRVRGHDFVRFDRQLSRHERARPKTFSPTACG